MMIGMNIRLNLIVTQQALQVRVMVRSYYNYLSLFNIIGFFHSLKVGTIHCRAIQNMPSFYKKKMHLDFL